MQVKSNIMPRIYLENILRYSRDQNYKGYDYSDGLSSKLLQVLPVENKWVNIAFQESAKRAPVNIRPILLIPKRRSFMGSGLFVMANLTAYDLTEQKFYLDQAEMLINWLLETRRTKPFGWGHNHAIQTLHTTVRRNTPSIVSGTFVSLAILNFSKYRNTEAYELIRKHVPKFIYETLDYTEFPSGARIKYKPTQKDGVYTINANALGARLLMELYHEFGEKIYREQAEAILDYVASQQTTIGGWKYTDPPSASHLSMDNHHNGFIIESFLRHKQITGSGRYSEELEESLSFYKEMLFTDEGAPNWDEENQYPRDIHASAQGIITFSQAGDTEFARKILNWALDNLYAGDGRFYYRKQKFYTKRFTLMRWCQSWMAFAISTYLSKVETTS